MDAFVAAGLYDPDAPNADERRELLEYLTARGFTVEQMAELVELRKRPLHRVAGLLLLGGDERQLFSATDLAQRCGVDVNDVIEFRAALALPVLSVDDADIPDTSIDDLALFQFASDAYGRDATLGLARVVGNAVAAMTEAAREVATTPLRDATELQQAQASEFSTIAWRQCAQLVAHVMEEQTDRSGWFVDELLRGEVVVAVSFVDLIGSTDWATNAGAQTASAALHRFERAASQLAAEHGARVVKFIGDEAMIVGPDAAGVAEVAARLCAVACADDVLPRARGAVGVGPVVARAGDYFGDVVNLVARATKQAPADGVVVTSEVAAQLARSRWRLEIPRTVSLRGVPGDVELVDAALDL